MGRNIRSDGPIVGTIHIDKHAVTSLNPLLDYEFNFLALIH